jgi:hypothetical protein
MLRVVFVSVRSTRRFRTAAANLESPWHDTDKQIR